MSRSPIDVVKTFLKDPTNPDIIGDLVAAVGRCECVTLNYENKDLRKIMPLGRGRPEDLRPSLDTFTRVFQFWENQSREIEELYRHW